MDQHNIVKLFAVLIKLLLLISVMTHQHPTKRRTISPTNSKSRNIP